MNKPVLAVAVEAPRHYQELKAWLEENYADLPKRLRAIAVFAIEHPDVMALQTVTTISHQAKVTPSALVRFAQLIGYKGFTDMQTVFQSSMRHISQPYAQRLITIQDDAASEQQSTVLSKFSQTAIYSINQLEQQADEVAIDKASKQIAWARTVYIAGQGRAEPVAVYLHYTLIKLGIQAVILNGMPSSMEDKIHLMQLDEVLVAISFSPYNTSTRQLVKIGVERKVPIIALTDSSLSPIAYSDKNRLEVLEQEVAGFRGLSATMCLALCLAVEAGKHKNNNSY